MAKFCKILAYEADDFSKLLDFAPQPKELMRDLMVNVFRETETNFVLCHQTSCFTWALSFCTLILRCHYYTKKGLLVH